MRGLIALIALSLAAPVTAQQPSTKGRVWKIMAGEIPARCMIEVATTTNEQHLLTQEAFRTATQLKATHLAGELLDHAAALDKQMRAQRTELTRLKDLLDNKLITQAEYDKVANATPDLSTLVNAMQAYPACNFFRNAYSDSVTRAAKLAKR